MEADQTDAVKVIYIVKQNDNVTAYDNFNEDTHEGPTNVTNATYGFLTEDEAMAFYKRQKAMLKFAGGPGLYYTYPVEMKITGRRLAVIDCEQEDGATYKLTWPAERKLCPQCDGDGTELCSGLKGVAFSEEDMIEAGDEFRESYMKGDYDVQCSECGGNKFVLEPLIDDLPENIRADYLRKIEGDRRFEAEQRQHARDLERGRHW